MIAREVVHALTRFSLFAHEVLSGRVKGVYEDSRGFRDERQPDFVSSRPKIVPIYHKRGTS